MKRILALLLTAMTMTASAQNADVAVKTGTFGNEWESLSQWECPEWFKDAKFGIWAHWGPQCQAEDGDWYARFMYYEGSGQYDYHVSHFGNPNVFGLKELCNAWKADQWNPEALSQDDAFECEYSHYLSSRVGDSYFNKWQGSGNLTDSTISQTVSGLPNGKYRLSVVSHSDVIHAGAWLFANNDKADMTQLTNNRASVVTEVADGSLTLGVELKNYTSNDCKFDHFTLEYLGGSNTTGIQNVDDLRHFDSRLNVTYMLDGRKINNRKALNRKMPKGVYIVNGQKVIVK